VLESFKEDNSFDIGILATLSIGTNTRDFSSSSRKSMSHTESYCLGFDRSRFKHDTISLLVGTVILFFGALLLLFIVVGSSLTVVGEFVNAIFIF